MEAIGGRRIGCVVGTLVYGGAISISVPRRNRTGVSWWGWLEAPNGSWVAWSLHSGSHGYRRLLSVLRVSKNLSKRSYHCARIRLREFHSFSRVQLYLSSSSFFVSSFLAFRFRAFLIFVHAPFHDDVRLLFNIFVLDNNCVSFIRKFSRKIYLCTCIILFIRYSMKNERKWLNSVCSDSANIFLERSVLLITCQFS